MTLLPAILAMAVLVSSLHGADVCLDNVFSNPIAWNFDPTFTSLSNLALPTTPSLFNASYGVCNFYDGMEVCCPPDVLVAITAAMQANNASLAKASAGLDHEQLFTMIYSLVELLVPNATIETEIMLFNQSLNFLRASQVQCMNSLAAYTEGMMCMSCVLNTSAFVDAATKSFLLSQDTCSGVVQRCSPVFDASRNVLTAIFNIIFKFFPKDDNVTAAFPDMCGGTVDHPGNCTEFMCDVWLNGVRTPSFSWDLPSQNITPPTFVNEPISPQAIISHLHSILSRPFARLAAAVSANQYVQNGYPALQVGCANQDCSLPTSSNSPESHTLAVALGSVGGVLGLVVLSAILLNKRRRGSREDGEYLMAPSTTKTYTSL